MDTERVAAMLSALGAPTRLRVVALLAENRAGLGAGEIARRLGVLQNTMSAQLKTLAIAGVVEVRREGRVLVYSLVASAMSEVAALLDGFAGVR